MRFFALLPLSAVFILSPFVLTQDTNSASGLSPAHSSAAAQSSAASTPSSFDQVIDRVAQREHYFNAQMRHLHPMVETYIQNFKGNGEAGVVPVSDQYF